MGTHKQGRLIKEIVDEIKRGQRKLAPIKITLELEASFEELRALRGHVDKFIADRFKQRWPAKTEADRILLSAMESLAQALPSGVMPLRG
jgi:hypothetical protein